MIGLKNSRQFFIQSEVKPKPIMTRLHTFSRVLRQVHVITSSFDWFTVLSVSFVIMIDWSHYFSVRLTALNWKMHKWRRTEFEVWCILVSVVKNTRWLNKWERQRYPRGTVLRRKHSGFSLGSRRSSRKVSNDLLGTFWEIVEPTTETMPLASKQQRLLQYDDK